jgi:hypothetical protein
MDPAGLEPYILPLDHHIPCRFYEDNRGKYNTVTRMSDYRRGLDW